MTARFVECVICLVHSWRNETVKFRIKYVFAKTGVLFKDFVNLSLPSLINDVAWSLAFSMYSVILGHLGSDAVAANAIANMALNIGAIVTRGFANATTVIVGKTIGENNIEMAKIYARCMVRLTAFFCVLGGGA